MDTHKKILIVDDDEAILEVVKLMLESEDYDVETSLNGAIIRRMSASKPDLILLDVLLSGEDGREICKQLKSAESTRNIPVIMFSAHYNANQAALNCGADDFLNKPFDLDNLLAKVSKHITASTA